MNINRANHWVVGAALAATLSRAIALAAASPTSSSPKPPSRPSAIPTAQYSTPDSCILLNRGDNNACNVDNSGRGDRPYKITRHRTPNDLHPAQPGRLQRL